MLMLWNFIEKYYKGAVQFEAEIQKSVDFFLSINISSIIQLSMAIENKLIDRFRWFHF